MKLTDILNEESLPLELIDAKITKDVIQHYKDAGYVLCYAEDGKLKVFTGPIKPFQAHGRRIYAITNEKFETVQKLSDNIEEMIRSLHEKAELYKKYVLGVLQKLTKEPE